MDYMGPISAFLGVGVVAVTWVLIGGLLSKLWEPAIVLIIPGVIWIVLFVLGVGVVWPAVWVWRTANGGGKGE